MDVGQFLAQFCECTNSELEELTLLGGRVTSALPPDGVFPAHLARLIVLEAQWSGANLCTLFTIISRRSGDSALFLNVAQAGMTHDQWRSFNTFLQGFKFGGLGALVFDGNRIGTGLAALLAQCENLQTLSLNACSVDDPLAHSLIAASIATSKTLHNLLLQGGERDSYRASIETYFAAIRENKSLRFLDISGNAIGDHVLDLLTPVFQYHPKIGEVLFDHNCITKLEALRGMYEIAGQTERRVFVRFPNNDVNRLRELGQIAEVDVHKLRLQCADTLRRRVKRPREHGSVDDDGARRGWAGRPGEFLAGLVSNGNTFPSEVQEVVDRQVTDWISDVEWVRSISVVDDPLVSGDDNDISIAELFAQIT
jgi:hypothetical protein